MGELNWYLDSGWVIIQILPDGVRVSDREMKIRFIELTKEELQELMR